MSRLLFSLVPELAAAMPHADLGRWPSALDRVEIGGQRWLAKREDLSTEGYAGNKIRPLELVFGRARALGLNEVWATGAWGSNHALATVVQARRAGLTGGALLWPQPRSEAAVENLRATLAVADLVRFSRSVVRMPAEGVWISERRRALVMTPGAATPYYSLGHAEGAIELAVQMREAGLGDADAIVLPIGSTCTTVGMLVGTALAAALGLISRPPRVIGVRVTPWPITAKLRVARMAVRAAALVGELGGPALRLGMKDVLQRLEIIGTELGGGYGVPTPSAWEARAAHLDAGAKVERISPGGLPEGADLRLKPDTTYSAKAAGWLMRHLGDRGLAPERTVFWATKSALPLPSPDLTREAALPPGIARWIHGRG
jgi:1-aminocyclopropane-1-carboxylate deaminase/D-cysteine desulfhydrase-like pyridoxal-dependent ACC family enzyme